MLDNGKVEGNSGMNYAGIPYFRNMRRSFLVVIMLIASVLASGQGCAVEVVADTLVACEGDTIFLNATGASEYSWSNDSTISCDTCPSPYLILRDTSTYVVVEGKSTVIQQATNGNFSSGNSGFLTNYTYNATSIWNEGTYAVGPNPNAVHPNFGTWGDHTSGSGNYMLVNGSASGTKILWRQVRSFPPGVQVKMRWWMLTFVTPAGSLQLKLFGNNVGSTVTTPASSGVWQQATRTFTVPASGNVILNLMTLSSAVAGNDFGIDDVTFEYECTSRDTVWLLPKSDAQIQLDSTPVFGCDSLCFEFVNTMDSAGALNYSWFLSDGTEDTSSTFMHCLSDTGIYTGYVRTTSAEGCSDSAALPSMRVGHTRKLDSISVLSAEKKFINGTWVLSPAEPMGIAAHFEGYAGSGGSDSLYLSFGSNSVQASPLSPNSIQYSWDPLSLSQEPQTICAYLFTADGCVDSICQNIAFFPTVTVPNFFTPNNDLRNDELIIESINAEVLGQRIFNRWGQLVFETTRPDEFWDGRINGNLASPGVYFLEVRASNSYIQDQPVVQRTAVHLMD